MTDARSTPEWLSDLQSLHEQGNGWNPITYPDRANDAERAFREKLIAEWPRIHAALSAQSERTPTRREVLGEVHQRLHDMKNLQRASAWPHVEGVARAEKLVWELLQDCK